MARPQVFTAETTLYHPVEGARAFPVGETDPGPMWSDSPGGDRSETSMGSMAQDLIAANDRADTLGERLAAQAHDMAQTAAEATAAKESLAAAEQRAIAAEAAQKAAEEAGAVYMEERDAARADLQRTSDMLRAQLAEADKVPGLVEQLAAANQALADANDKLSAVKPAKAAKADAAPASDAAAAPDAT